MGLTAAGIDIHRTDRKIVFDIVEGWLWDGIETRGKDTIIPGKRGHYRQNRLSDRRIVVLEGYVQGLGVDVAAQRIDFQTNLASIASILNPEQAVGVPIPIVATAPYRGLSAGTKTIQVYFVNVAPGDMIQHYFQRLSIEFECVEDPPDWT